VSRTYDCPNCAGAVAFQSSVAVFAVCPYCRSMVVRHDVNVEAIGQMAQLPPDLSPLQLGVRGKIDGEDFHIIGRVRLAYDEGSWNEWCALFPDGRYGWIAEAQGFFMVSFEVAAPADFPIKPDDLRVGAGVTLGEETFAVVDRKHTTCLGGEGELPFVAQPERRATSVDFTGPGVCFANAEFSDDGTRVFVGRYARFDEFGFFNLRAVPGWSEGVMEQKLEGATSLKCPNCGGTVELRAAGFSMSATCGSCASLIDTATPDLAVIQRAKGRQRMEPVIPLGRRGKLFDVNYEVIGFQHVKDEYVGWSEYLLFNPWQGFVWLVTYNGHWSFVQRLLERPEVTEGIFTNSVAHAKFNGESYRLFAAGPARTDFVLGEFYWKVSVGSTSTLADFVCPPRILSREIYPGLAEQTWSQGEYIEADVVRQAFNLDDLAAPIGIYLNQPNRFAEKGRQLKWLVPLILVALLAIQFISASRAANERVFSGEFKYQAPFANQLGATNPVAVTAPFEIKGGDQALCYYLFAPVDNKWVELDIDLVNAETHQVAASRNTGIEYYHGYDDGNWSEGSQSGSVLVPAVAPGKYYLAIDVAADPTLPEIPFTVTVVRDVTVWSNFWLALVLLLIYPLYCWLRSFSFESQRWSDSDYSPFLKFESSDDDE
jgi:hypothetical protein